MWFRDQARAAAAVFAELDAASVDPVLSSEHAAFAERLVAAQDRHRQLSVSVAHLRGIVSKEDAESKVRVVMKQHEARGREKGRSPFNRSFGRRQFG